MPLTPLREAKGGDVWVNHDCHDLGMMGMMHRRPCPVDSCLRRNDVGGAKGGEWFCEGGDVGEP